MEIRTKSQILDHRELLKIAWAEDAALFVEQVLGWRLETFHAKLLNYKGVYTEDLYFDGVLAPRGSGKSEIGTIGDAIHKICHDVNLAGQLIAESKDTANVFLSGIKQQFAQNDLMRAVYGNHVSENEWSATRITTSQRTEIRKEPTLQTMGVEGRIVGRHVDYQWCDDMVSLTNSATEKTRAKLVTWYNNVLKPILNPGGTQKIRGTRYYGYDLYAYLIETYGSDIFLTIPALTWRDTPDGDREEVSYWPARFPVKVLQEKRKKDPISFSLQYQNDATILQSDVLDPGALKMAKKVPDISELIIYIGIDPARKTSGDGCLFSITTIGLHKETGFIYILRQRDRKVADPDKMCAFIYEEFRWCLGMGGTVLMMGCEANAFQATLVAALKANHHKYGYLPVREHYTIKDKETRFISVARFFNSGMVFFCEGTEYLFEDIAKFPDIKIKDRVDSCMIAFEQLDKAGVSFLGIPDSVFSWGGTGGTFVFGED